MQKRLLKWLVCPTCGSALRLGKGTEESNGEIVSGVLGCEQAEHEFPIRNSIPRFVESANYAQNFGLQWQRFAQTQLDSANQNTISHDRFSATTDWKDLRGKVILDGGCGMGRFAEVALDLGAEVIALDYSVAADVCQANLRRFGARLHVIQGNLLALPIAPGSLDAAYSMGVLQHTPDPATAFSQLAAVVKAGGEVIGDAYQSSMLRYLNSIYWYRPALRHLSPDVLLPIVERVVSFLHPAKERLMTLSVGHPLLAIATSMAIPINTHGYQFPFLSKKQSFDWSVLNTFDAYSPRYDKPQTPKSIRTWAVSSGLVDIEVFCKPGFGDGTALVCRGKKPLA